MGETQHPWRRTHRYFRLLAQFQSEGRIVDEPRDRGANRRNFGTQLQTGVRRGAGETPRSSRPPTHNPGHTAEPSGSWETLPSSFASASMEQRASRNWYD